MKQTAIVMLSALILVSVRSGAQNVTLNLKGVSLQQVFKEIHKQTGFEFFYSSHLLAGAHKIDIKVEDAPLIEVLNTCFKNQPIDYELVSNTIVVKEKTHKNEEQLSVTASSDQFTHKIEGRVLDQDGVAVPGITVEVEGSSQATMTNEKGEFSLTRVNKNTVLVFTAVNVEKLETLVGDRTSITQTIQIKRSVLDDVQIIGYGTTSRRLNVGSIGSISAVDIENQPVINPLQALEGRVAGVEMTVTSGEPAAPVDIKIRGQNTAFAATSYPLFIVDGVATQNNLAFPGNFGNLSPMSSINPLDIENITILKDADATSVYGSRGANGVVLINTKKGKAGPTSLSVDFSTGFNQASHLIEGFLKTPEYLAMRKQAFINDGIQPNPVNAPDLTVWSQTAYTDWQKEMLGNTGSYSNVKASLSGGDDRVRYLLSAGYTYSEGIVWGTNYDKRASVHLNIENNSADKRFQMSTSIYYSNEDIEKTWNNPLNRTPPNYPKYDSAGNVFIDPNHTRPNPWLLKNQYTTAGADNLIANTVMGYRILSGLKISVSIGYSNYILDGFNAIPSYSIDPVSNYPAYNAATLSNGHTSTFVTEPQLDYNTHINKGKLHVMAGGTLQDQKAGSDYVTGQNFSSDALLHNLGAASIISDKGSGNTQYKYESVFTRVTYNWQDRYLINTSFRRDGSSRFGEGYKFGNFWSAAAGWIFSNENFFKSLNAVFNYGKLRGSYGTTGNDQIGDYQYLAFYAPNAQPYNGVSGIYSSQFTNSNYRWEETYKGDIGLDLGAFNNRILLTVDYFNNKSENLLAVIPLAPQSGYQNYTGNLPAVVQNKGWEFTLNTVNIKNRDFSWSSTFNITLPKNTLLAYPDLDNSPYKYLFYVGKSIRSVKEFRFAGISPANGHVLFYTADGMVTDGSGSPGNPVLIAPGDFTYVGTQDPSLFGGLGNILTYKSFELNFFLQFSESHTVNSFLGTTPLPFGAEQNTIQAMLNNTWTKPGQLASQPVLTTNNFTPAGDQFTNYSFNSSANFVSNAYIRLKTLALTWNMPHNWSSGAKLKHVQVYVQAQNLFTITSYVGLDPESTLSVPVLKTILFGLRAEL
jgi:TonB-linked SusC/RagA family outer membrane protein